MDTISISKSVSDLTAIILPLLPYLVKGAQAAGEEFAKVAAGEAGKKVTHLAETLWEKIKPTFEHNPEAQRTLDKALVQPNDPQVIYDMSQVFKEALKDPQTKKDIRMLLKHEDQKDTTIKAALRIGKVYGKAVGMEITNMKSLRAVHAVANITVDTVGKKGVVKGMVIKSLPKRKPKHGERSM